MSRFKRFSEVDESKRIVSGKINLPHDVWESNEAMEKALATLIGQPVMDDDGNEIGAVVGVVGEGVSVAIKPGCEAKALGKFHVAVSASCEENECPD